jgi:hypothetical protein
MQELAERIAEDEISEETSAANRQLVDDLIGLGWQRTEGGEIGHPDKRELNVWLNPYSDELLFSPGLVDFMKEHNQPWVGVLTQFFTRR